MTQPTLHDLAAADSPGTALRTFPFNIGRQANNHLVLRDARISRYHARIERDGPGFRLLDLVSTHGTTLNGTPVQSEPLQHGDVIGLGRKFEFVFLERPDPAQLLRCQPAREHMLMGDVSDDVLRAPEPEPEPTGPAPCRISWTFRCNLQWESLQQPGFDPDVRHCGTCDKYVYLCRSAEDLRTHKRAGHCIAIAGSLVVDEGS